ncbi:MAG: hypothetical protein EXR75_02035 [Myxococcales bacterium]|nr:hypothetical protein [Myxococcales bacterium]
MRASFALLGFALLSFAFGCVPHGPSRLEQGLPIDTGRRRFDTYFADVAELREKVSGLDADNFPVRQPLVEEVGVDVDAPLHVVFAATRARAEKMKGFGVLMDLRLTPNPIVIAQSGSLTPDDKEDTLLKAIQESAVRGMSTYREYQQLAAVAEQLDAQRSEVAEDINRLPPNFSHTELVETELVAAGRVLEGVNRRLAQETRSLALFLVGLSEAVATGGAELRDTSCTEALAQYKPKRGFGRRPRAAPPRASGAKAGPAPAPRPAAGGDFDM